MRLITLLFLLTSINSFAAKKKIKYEYKKYEKFDLESFQISADKGAPGDITVLERFRNRFKNKFPSKKSFNKEMIIMMDSIY